MTEAIIFDLDDTLYSERRWLLSGFAAVARELETRWSRDRVGLFRLLSEALRRGHRADALQRMCARCGQSPAIVPELVGLIRSHEPRIALRPAVRAMVIELKRHFRIGILTNGMPSVQRRKVAALGVEPLVDAVVYAAHHGGGKPDPKAFYAVADQVKVAPAHATFVGDDPTADIAGARAVGMRTVRGATRRQGRLSDGICPEADIVVERVTELPSRIAGVVHGPGGR